MNFERIQDVWMDDTVGALCFLMQTWPLRDGDIWAVEKCGQNGTWSRPTQFAKKARSGNVIIIKNKDRRI